MLKVSRISSLALERTFGELGILVILGRERMGVLRILFWCKWIGRSELGRLHLRETQEMKMSRLRRVDAMISQIENMRLKNKSPMK